VKIYLGNLGEVEIPQPPEGYQILENGSLKIKSSDLVFDVFQVIPQYRCWMPPYSIKGMRVDTAASIIPDGICYAIARKGKVKP